MRKIYFLIGGVCLLISVVSCSSDDNFKQDIKEQHEIQMQKVFISMEKVNQSLDTKKVNRGSDDKDQDKKRGK